MNVIRKDATITNTDESDPGTFEVVLSAPTLDRDGDTLLPDEWKQPLPDHITFDSDHGMSVATTVGSGVPEIDDKTGNLIVRGTYSSLPRAQEVRTLVNEGHIRTTSVAFMTTRSKSADGKSSTVTRELLNGAFVAIPSNREAVVLSSKSAARKEELANASRRTAVKAVQGSLEATQGRARDALRDAYPGMWVYLTATIPSDAGGLLVFELEDPDTYDCETFKQSYTDDGSVVTLQGERSAVDVMEVITPDPDEDAADSGAADVPASGAEKSAPVAGTTAAPVEDADSRAVTDEELEAKALEIQAAQFI